VAWPPVLTLNPKMLGSIPKQLKKANTNFNILPGNQIFFFNETSDEFNQRSSTLQISTEANDVQVNGNQQK
jgi:hypothetical protein